MSQHPPDPEPTPSAETTGPTDHPGAERAGGINGKVIIGITLSLFIVVPVVAYLVNAWASADLNKPPPPLQWSQRLQWEFLPVTGQSMRRGMMSSARTGQEFFDFEFDVSEDQEQAIRRVARLAARPRAEFIQPDTRDRLTEIAQAHADLFYPAYVLGVWHRLAGNADQADHWMTRSFREAPVVIRQIYRNPQDEPLANAPVPAQAFALDRVRNDQLDVSLVLIFPPNRTDAQGRVDMPLYQMIYREVPADPERLIRPANPDTEWFTFPGRFGELRPKTLRSGSPPDSSADNNAEPKPD